MLLPCVAHADVNDFTITSFNADYYLSNADPQGQLRIVEQINVDFTDNNHGILRAIPRHYKNLPLDVVINKITSNSGAPTQYATSDDNNDNEVLKIGDPNRTVTGNQEYTIDYTVDNVISFYSNHDELYWDVNGTNWQQIVDSARATLHLPTGLHFADPKPVCYAGFYGERNHNCTIHANGQTLTTTAMELAGSATLSFVAALPKGYFVAPGSLDYAQQYIEPAIQFLLPVVMFGSVGFVWWLRRGRDAKGTGVIVAQYDAPDKMLPLEVGAVHDFQVTNRTITATMIDLAIRKYIRIIETDKSNFIGSSKTFSLELLSHDWHGLTDWEQTLLSNTFQPDIVGQITELSKPNIALKAAVKIIGKQVDKSLTDRGYFKANPRTYVSVSAGSIVIIGFFVLISTPLSSSGLLGWGFLAGVTIFGLFFHFMAARTVTGVAALEHIKGLKLYLEVAEKDRLAKLQSPDAPYAAPNSAPVKTIDLFEKLLPYAIVLKVEKQWAKQFENLYKAQPDWYAGNLTAFNVGYLAGSLSGGFLSAVGTTFGTSASSSGSGFGGGGFSGGGGGGGGGGGW